jgi:hypothetical protein
MGKVRISKEAKHDRFLPSFSSTPVTIAMKLQIRTKKHPCKRHLPNLTILVATLVLCPEALPPLFFMETNVMNDFSSPKD